MTTFIAALSIAAPANARLKIVAPATVQAPQQVRFSANPSRPTKRIAFFVDGRRRWVDRSPNFKYGRTGYVDLRPGRHMLKARAVQRGRIVTSRRAVMVEPPAADAATQDAPAPPPARSTAPHRSTAPASKPEPVAAPQSESEPQAPESEPVPNGEAPAEPTSDTPILDAGFENGLANWNTAGVGEVVPSVVSGDARSGTHAGRVVLTGSQSRSELGLGGNGTADPNGVDFYDGNEYWYGFSFNIQHMVYGHPGAHNVIMQFKSEGEGSPNFALQLWDYEGDNGEYADHPRGLWVYSQGAGDRYVAPAPEHAWHDVAIHFRASEHSNGFYELFVDGELVDQRSGISMIVPGKGSAYIKNGLYRNGSTIPGTSELLVDSAMLGHSASSVQPG